MVDYFIKYGLIVLGIGLFPMGLSAQIKTEVTVDKINVLEAFASSSPEAKRMHELYKAYKSEIDDAIKLHKKHRKEIEKNIRRLEDTDSSDLSLDSLGIYEQERQFVQSKIDELKEHKKLLKKDTIWIVAKAKIDSTDWDPLLEKQLTGRIKELNEIQSNQSDQTLERLTNDPTLEARNQVDEYKSMGEDIKENGLDLAQLQNVSLDQAFKVNPFKSKVSHLDKAHERLSKLKKKFTEVPDINNLGTATRNQSVDDTFLSRFFYGGTNAIAIKPLEKTVKWELSLLAGFLITQKWRVGGSGSISMIIDDKKPYAEIGQEEKYKTTVFTQYTIWKRFFGHVEWERKYGVFDVEKEQIVNLDACNIGLGRYFKIPGLKKAQGMAMVLVTLGQGRPSRQNISLRFGLTNK